MMTSGVSLHHDASDLQALRVLLVKLIAEGQVDDALDLTLGLLSELRDQNDSLQVRLKNALRQLYGKRSEKMSGEQLALFQRLLGTELAAPEATPEATPDSTPTPALDPKPARNKPVGIPHGRSPMPEKLPREVKCRDVAECERTCATCGKRMIGFGHESYWQVEFRPGHFVVEVTECEKVACEHCRDCVVTAPAPGKVIEGGQPGPGLLAKILVDKAEDHIPLERQHRRLEREGLTVPSTTLEGWWAAVADLLQPLHTALLDQALSVWIPQIDATGIDVLDRDHVKGIRLGHVWTVVGAETVVYTFAKGKSAGLQELFEKRGKLNRDPGRPVLCDGEGLFNSAQSQTGISLVLLHCWMHARRYFERALKAGDLRAAPAMKWIAQMYAIEREANEQKVSVETRTQRRLEQTLPLLEALRQWVMQIRPGVLPSSPLGKALGYVERRWMALVAFVVDGHIALDTGEVERQIRRLALGRNNWLFAGSDLGAKRLCTVATLCATCRKLHLDPWAYFRDVLQAIANKVSIKTLIADFSPAAWGAKKKAQQLNAQQPAAT